MTVIIKVFRNPDNVLNSKLCAYISHFRRKPRKQFRGSSDSTLYASPTGNYLVAFTFFFFNPQRATELELRLPLLTCVAYVLQDQG